MNPWENVMTQLEQNAKYLDELEKLQELNKQAQDTPKRESKSIVPGICWYKGKIKASGTAHGIQVHLYYGDDLEEAIRLKKEFDSDKAAGRPLAQLRMKNPRK